MFSFFFWLSLLFCFLSLAASAWTSVFFFFGSRLTFWSSVCSLFFAQSIQLMWTVSDLVVRRLYAYTQGRLLELEEYFSNQFGRIADYLREDRGT